MRTIGLWGRLLGLGALGLAPLSCNGAVGDDLVDDVFTNEEWAKIQELSPLLDPPDDPTNRYQHDAGAAALGQKFFFESDHAGPLTVGDDGSNGALGQAGETGKVSCAACHHGPWLIDNRSTPNNASLGADWLPRNAASMVNTVYYFPWIENDGLLDSLWSEGMVDIEFNLSYNSSRLALAHVIFAKYRDEYNAVFDPDLDPALDPTHPDAARFPATGLPGLPEWEVMNPADQDHVTGIYVNWGKAMHAYLTLLVSKDAPFDRYVAGDTAAISAAAKRGLKLFVGKAGCVECHATPHFSDDDFHNNGLAIAGDHIDPTEKGRATTVPLVLAHEFNSKSPWSDDPSDDRLDGLIEGDDLIGLWRTKGLRQIAETAPYMHSGQFSSLAEVVDFYNNGGSDSGFQGVKDDRMQPLNLSDGEKSDLVEFLKTLTGEPVPAELLRDSR
ncbi:MAG: cytochrome c peroxidase [Nannocystaceae bacterium]